MKLEIGDWVTGNTADSELIHGFIESMDAMQDTFHIQVTHSDNEAVIGRLVELNRKAVKKLPEAAASNEAELMNWIELALMTKDEAWFAELSGALARLRQKPKPAAVAVMPSAPPRNRLRRV